MRFELGKPVDLDEWALARKRLYDTNVFRLVDIQPVPIGEAVDGVQPVKARVAVEEYPPWAFRYGFQIEGERDLSARGVHEHAATLAWWPKLKNPNLFGRALTFGAFGMYQRDSRDATLFLATSRLFGWRARSSLYGFYSARSASRRHRGRGAGDHDVAGLQRRSALAHAAACRLSTAIASSAIAHLRSRSRPTIPFPFDFVSNLAKLSTATCGTAATIRSARVKGTFSSISFDHVGARPRVRRPEPQAADAAVRVRAARRLVLASRAQGARIRARSAVARRSFPGRRRDERARLRRRQPRIREEQDGLPLGGDRC